MLQGVRNVVIWQCMGTLPGVLGAQYKDWAELQQNWPANISNNETATARELSFLVDGTLDYFLVSVACSAVFAPPQ